MPMREWEAMELWSARHHSLCVDCGLDLGVCDCRETDDGDSGPLESAERAW